MAEIFFSVDVETDGPIPGPHSMLSLGAAAFFDGHLISTFSVNLNTLEGAAGAPDTMVWWETQKEAWEACRKDTIDPKIGVERFLSWVDGLCNTKKSRAVFVGYPTGFDFTFTYWYLIKFTGKSPFSFSALDIKTMAWALLGGGEFRNATKRNFPRKWFGQKRHNHVALDDAIEQGEMFCNMLKEFKK